MGLFRRTSGRSSLPDASRTDTLRSTRSNGINPKVQIAQKLESEISQPTLVHTKAVKALHPSDPGTVAAISDDQGGTSSELQVISMETASTKDHEPEKGSEEFQGKNYTVLMFRAMCRSKLDD